MTMRRSYFFLLFTALFVQFSHAQDSLNIELFGQFHRGDMRYSGSWAYIDADGNEYALLGTRTGTAAYPIDSQLLMEAGFVSGPESNWREITVVGDFAYVVTEGASDTTGMQIIDLQYLPDSLHLLTTYTETFTKGHILQRDIYSDSAYVYVSGTSSTEGIHIMDVSNPAVPTEVGLYEPGYYIHDCHVKNDLVFACAFYEGIIDVLDISDKSNPVKIAEIDDTDGNTHSCWVTEDDHYLVVCSELDGLPARIYNIEDLGNVFEVARYTANPQSLVHNPYILGDFCFMTHNSEGLRILDIADPELPVEVGFYDTSPSSGGGSAGLWSACPFLPSGKIIGGNREDGLYVWTFNNTNAGRIYGIVKDSISGEILTEVELIVLENQDTLVQDFDAKFKWGALPGDYNLSAKKSGYLPKVTNLNLSEEDSLTLVIELVPEIPVSADEPEAKPFLNFKTTPNPFSDFTKVDLSNFKNAQTLQLLNAKGQILKTYVVENKREVSIQRNELPTGNYFLQLSNKSGEIIATSQITVQ